MNESFSLYRISNLFKWQIARIKPAKFIGLSILLIVFTYYYIANINSYGSNTFSNELVMFIFITGFCMNFFKQLLSGETAGGFLLIPSSTNEKFVFLMTNVVVIPMVLLIAMVQGGDYLARRFHEIPDSYSFMNLKTYLIMLIFASALFFVHCLNRKLLNILRRGFWLSIIVGILPIIFLIPFIIINNKSKETLENYIWIFSSITDQPFVLIVISAIFLIMSYFLFNRNEISNAKIYR